MDEKQRVEDLIKQLDAGFENGVGHVNVDVDASVTGDKSVETMGCADCSKNPLACSVPTLHDGLDAEEN